MSVINKVLKDLDKRGRKPFDATESSSAVASDKQPSRQWLWWFSGVALVAIAALLAYRWLAPENSANPGPVVTATEPKATTAEPIQPYRPQQPQQPEVTEQEPQPEADAATASASSLTNSFTLPEPIALDSSQPQAPSTPVAEEPEPTESEPVFVKKAVNLSPQQVAAQHAEKASTAQQQGRLSDAESHWQNAVRVLPTDVDYRQQLAALQYGRGKITQALVTLNDGLKRQPEAHSLRLLSAKILQKEGQHQAALLLLGKANPSVAEHLEYYQLTAQLAQQLEQYQLAATSYGRLAQVQPNNGRWHLGQAIALERFDSTAAAAAYERALMHLTHRPSREFVQNRLQQLNSPSEVQ